ncbi:MAG: DUF6531 domain-containing protein, partial [Sulfurifustaceae bacterium]
MNRFEGDVSAPSNAVAKPNSFLRRNLRYLVLLLLSYLGSIHAAHAGCNTNPNDPHVCWPDYYVSSQSDAHNACLIDQADLRAYYGHGECVGPSYTAAGIGYYSVYDDLPVSSIKAQYYFPPAGFTCPSGQHFDAPGQCVADVVRDSLGCQCSVAFARRPVRALVDTGDRGNPASASTGNKYTGEIDFSAGDAILPVGRFYNSQFNQDLGFGFGWISRFINHVVVSGTTFVIRDNSGREELFTCITSGTCTGSADSQLTVIKDWTGYSVVYRDRMVEKYNSLATIERQIDSNGRTTTYN